MISVRSNLNTLDVVKARAAAASWHQDFLAKGKTAEKIKVGIIVMRRPGLFSSHSWSSAASPSKCDLEWRKAVITARYAEFSKLMGSAKSYRAKA